MTRPKPYPEYRDSGIEWVGPIPMEWETRPLFAVARESTASNKAGVESNLLSLSYGRIVRKDIAANDGLLPASFDTYQIISRNDIVLRLTDLQNDKRSLRSALSPERGIITSAYLAVTPTRIRPTFLGYLLRAYDLQKVFYAMGGGLRQSIKFPDMKWLPVVVPPEPLQKLISDYLDRETIQIDDLISKQERLIELLTEKREAIVAQAVTRGLDPSVPVKPSGVAWLGYVPRTWTVSKVRFLFEIGRGRVISNEDLVDAAPYPVYSSQTKNDGCLGHIDTYDYDRDQITWTTDGINAGTSFIRKGRHNCTNVCGTLFPLSSEIRLEFANYFLQFVTQFYKRPDTNGAKIMSGEMANVVMLVPPLEDQDAVIASLNRSTKWMTRLTDSAHEAIRLLRERQSALIAAAVTGKIDVQKGAS